MHEHVNFDLYANSTNQLIAWHTLVSFIFVLKRSNEVTVKFDYISSTCVWKRIFHTRQTSFRKTTAYIVFVSIRPPLSSYL